MIYKWFIYHSGCRDSATTPADSRSTIVVTRIIKYINVLKTDRCLYIVIETPGVVETTDPAPEFELPGTGGEEIDTYRLSEYTDRGAVVLAFYPFDFSPVCAGVLCDFRDAEFLTVTDDVDVFGISLDSCYAHKEFIQRYELPFPLLSDPTGRVTEQYGLAYDEWEHHEGVPKRALVTVDDSQHVRYTWQTEDAYQSPSIDDLQQAVTAVEDPPPR